MDLLQAYFYAVINMAVTASFVILMVLLTRLFLRRAPKVFSYLLWSVVGFRLICPVSFSSILSILNIRFYHNSNNSGNNSTMLYFTNITRNTNSSDITTKVLSTGASNGNIHAVNQVQNTMITPDHIMAVLWITGIAVLLVYSLFSFHKLKRRVANAVLLKDNIYQSDEIPSPFVLGILKPKIYIPFRLGELEQSYILKHEQYHIKRLDYIIKPAAFLLLMVYWFHPLVWVAFFCMCRDMEMSCDEKVLSESGIFMKKDYSLSLLSFAVNHRFPKAGPLFFGESDVKRRIKNILSFRKPRLWLMIPILIVCLITIIACAANPKANEENVIPVALKLEAPNQAGQLYDNIDSNVEDMDLTSNNITYPPSDIEKESDEKILTMDTLLQITEWNHFSLKDFSSYSNAISDKLSSEEALNAYLTFSLMYDGKSYELQVSYMKADNKIDMIRLVKNTDSDVILIYSSDSKYTVNTDIYSFLKKNIKMSDYLTYQLPEGYVDSDFIATLEYGGGSLFLKNGEMPELNENAPINWYAAGGVLLLPNSVIWDSSSPFVTFEDGRLIKGDMHVNHTGPIADPVVLNYMDEQAVLMEVSHDLYTAAEVAIAEDSKKAISEDDQTSKMYEIYFAREDGDMAYCIFLNEKYFTYDEAIAFIKTVKFTEEAFQ